jgi:hypothetical protein
MLTLAHGPAGYLTEGVREGREDRFEALNRAARAARKVHHQGIAQDHHHSTGKIGRGGGRTTRGPHRLGQPWNDPLGEREGRLGRHIAGSEPRPSCRDHQSGRPPQFAECRLDRGLLVGDDPPLDDAEAGTLQNLGHGGTRLVLPPPLRHPVAHGQDRRLHTR